MTSSCRAQPGKAKALIRNWIVSPMALLEPLRTKQKRSICPLGEPFLVWTSPQHTRPPAWRSRGGGWEESTVCEPGHFLTLGNLDHFPATTLLDKYQWKGEEVHLSGVQFLQKKLHSLLQRAPSSAVGMEPGPAAALPYTLTFVSPHSQSRRLQAVLGTTAQSDLRKHQLWVWARTSTLKVRCLCSTMFNVTTLWHVLGKQTKGQILHRPQREEQKPTFPSHWSGWTWTEIDR